MLILAGCGEALVNKHTNNMLILAGCGEALVNKHTPDNKPILAGCRGALVNKHTPDNDTRRLPWSVGKQTHSRQADTRRLR